MSLDWIAGRGQPLRGEITVPGDKSISHRAVMLAAIAEGQSRISGFLEGEDTRATARIFGRLGVRIETPSASERIVHGVGLHGLLGSDGDLDCGNAGTGMRLLSGVLAGQAFDSVLVGDASLSKRPMRRVIDPLSKMGACSTAAPKRPYEPTPSAKCSGASGEAYCRGSPGNASATPTAAAPAAPSQRRTEGSGTKRLSTVYTATTSHTVIDSTGAKPRRAPGCSVPQPPMSITSTARCASQPTTRAGAAGRFIQAAIR